ncbi:MAG: hypothetical protein HGB04_06525 [Chlorobiaceae bacterium]|nr:hypothetical protein [Chlorobiaceae bacterium]
MSIEEVREQFDLPRLEAFGRYTAQWPPLHVMIAGFLGLGKPAVCTNNQEDELAKLIQELPQTPRRP